MRSVGRSGLCDAYTESRFGSSGSTKTYYFTGIAAAGAAIKVVVGVKADSVTQEISFTAPELLGDVLYFKVGGVWKQTTLYRKGGTWKNALAKFKAGGTWK